LPISIVPVVLGAALASREGLALRPAILGCALLAAILIHLGTNLQNDVSDGRRGADGPDRRGPPRATAQGWLSARTVQAWALAMFGAAIVPGAWLVVEGGWPILVIGLAAIGAGAAYTAGPCPTGYRGLGEVFVLVFFGPVAVAGTFFLGTGRVTIDAVLAGLVTGFFAAAVLVVNNLRDRVSDARAGKRTLAVRYGAAFARREYRMAILLPYVLIGVLAWRQGVALAFALVTLPWAVRLTQAIEEADGVRACQRALHGANRLLLVTGLVLVAALA